MFWSVWTGKDDPHMSVTDPEDAGETSPLPSLFKAESPPGEDNTGTWPLCLQVRYPKCVSSHRTSLLHSSRWGPADEGRKVTEEKSLLTTLSSYLMACNKTMLSPRCGHHTNLVLFLFVVVKSSLLDPWNRDENSPGMENYSLLWVLSTNDQSCWRTALIQLYLVGNLNYWRSHNHSCVPTDWTDGYEWHQDVHIT